MIIDNFNILDWEVKVLYECTCDNIDYIIKTLKEIKCPNKYIKEAINNLGTCNLNIGLTYSNIRLKSSVIVINKTSSFSQLINTIAHEYYHLICHISKTLDIKDEE
jgi:Zn-dependent peptidase ImmA (M78 family)